MVAVVVVSLSELQTIVPNIKEGYHLSNPTALRTILHNMGLDTNKPFEHQEGLTHRNRLNAVVTCSRWVGNERTDEQWTKGGYASREARNEASGSKMVRDLDPHKYHQL